jgi:hypothetical protein
MGAKSDLIFVILVIVALGFVWVFTGGPERARNQGVFIKPPAPLDSGETYGKINVVRSSVNVDLDGSGNGGVQVGTSDGNGNSGAEVNPSSSEFENKVSIKSSSTGPRKSSPLEEYITLSASSRNNEKISITGWKLESIISKKQATIGGATEVYISGLVNSEPTLKLAPGETVIISTGLSPIGASFKVNKCSGYQEQFQDFFPKLSKKCPYPDDEFDDIALSIPSTDNKCEDFVDSISRCEMELTAFPAGVSSQCTEFVSNTINYSGCVKNHRDDLNFFTKEWRVFLKKDSELWRAKRETIRLIDNDGKVVDTYTY